jgi:hypothetical protein
MFENSKAKFVKLVSYTHSMQQTHHHKNTTHAVYKKENYRDLNFGMNLRVKTASTQIVTTYEVAAFPATNFNAPGDGQVGRNML